METQARLELPFKDPEKRKAYFKAWSQKFREKNGKSYTAFRVARWADELKVILGVCQGCGTKDNLEFAHIKETPLSSVSRFRGRWRRYLDVIHHPDCYTFLCFLCHNDFDAGRLSITPKSLLELQYEVGAHVFRVPAGDTPMANVPVIQVKG